MWEFFMDPYPFARILFVASCMYLVCYCARQNYLNREGGPTAGTAAPAAADVTSNAINNEPTEIEQKLRAKVLNVLFSDQKYGNTKKKKSNAVDDDVDEEKGDVVVETKKNGKRKSIIVKNVVDDMEQDETSMYDTDEEHYEDCLICLEEFRPNDTIISLNCNHKFHKSCILAWAMTKDECPTCRQSMWNTNAYTSIQESFQRTTQESKTNQTN